MNAVLGLVRHCIDEDDSEQVKDLLKSALLSGEHLRGLLGDVLEIKKLQNEEFILQPESVDLKNDVFKTANSMFASLCQGKRIRIVDETDLDSLPKYLISDGKRLLQIATNIFGNAIKYTPPGGVATVKTTYNYDTEELTFQVSDTGIGMSKETVSNLFKRFNQASDGTRKDFEGTGLGLAITKQIMDRMGGKISVESELGVGTTMTLTAPIPVDWEREKGMISDEQSNVTIKPLNHSTLEDIKILCVDDSSINLTVLSLTLTKAGASVTTALSAKEALELISTHQFDIVLTDISMPEMDGEELQQELKAWRPNLPVVAITGNVFKLDIKRFLANGFVAALTKPHTREELISLVTSICRKENLVISSDRS